MQERDLLLNRTSHGISRNATLNFDKAVQPSAGTRRVATVRCRVLTRDQKRAQPMAKRATCNGCCDWPARHRTRRWFARPAGAHLYPANPDSKGSGRLDARPKGRQPAGARDGLAAMGQGAAGLFVRFSAGAVPASPSATCPPAQLCPSSGLVWSGLSARLAALFALREDWA